MSRPINSGAYCSWLTDKGSLTFRLQQRYVRFGVRRLRSGLGKPIADECALMKLPIQNRAFTRNVLLMGGSQAVVFAHSVLPLNSLRGVWSDLGSLGNKPLGATLFANRKVQRTPLEYKKLSKNNALYRAAVENLNVNPSFLWARRSVFRLNSTNILVTEVFLPAILEK